MRRILALSSTAGLILAVLGPGWVGSALGQAFRIPLESTVYDDLEHFRALGYWSGSLEFRPKSGADLVDLVVEIEEQSRTKPLETGDLRRLSRLRRAAARLPRFREDDDATASTGSSSAWSFGGRLQYLGQESGLDSLADLDRRPRRDALLFLSLGVEVPAGFYAQSRFFEDYSHLTPRPGNNDWVDNLPPDAKGILTDPRARNDQAILGFHHDWLDLSFGRQDRRWGTGRRGTLFLSENPFPLDGFSLSVRTRYVSGTSLFAQTLRGTGPAGTEFPERPLGDAYYSAHRFEIHPPLPFRLGLYEAVAYGGRGVDLGFANPIGFLVAMTQDLFDRTGSDDNKKLLGFDLSVDLPPVNLYGEFLFDRVIAFDETEGGEGAASTFGQLVGLRYANPFGLSGADLDLEYAHLDPQVYFHRDRDPRSAFLTEGELIGHWMGPNADAFYAAVTVPTLDRVGTIRFEFEQVRSGLVDGRRGVETGFFNLTRDAKKWITGDVALERTLALGIVRSLTSKRGGTLETRFTLARVERSGAWDGDGWQTELRLNWSADRRAAP